MMDAMTLTMTLGGHWHGSYGSAPCPVCQAERHLGQCALSLRSEGGRLLTYCHKSGCDFRSIIEAVGAPSEGWTVDPVAAREADAKRAAYEAEQIAKARKIWDAGKAIEGTKGEAYLRGRGITCPLPPSLRWVFDTHHGPSGRWLSAMVADVSTGGLHRTFFEKNGSRIGKNAKMMLGPTSGGHVTICEAAAPLVVAEGIETALSLASGLLSGPAAIWAALSTSGMRSLQLPLRPGKLIIATDGDEAGRLAGNALAERASSHGWQVSLLPAPEGQDWNDVLVQRGAAA